MNPLAEEWVEKANGDFRTASREMTALDQPNYDAVCFHAQQCIEKLMKALLLARGELPPKSHDLAQLFRQLAASGLAWPVDIADLHFLTRAAVDFRYPGENADEREASEALAICCRLRTELLTHLV